jgi:hypothetical protein
MIRHIPLGALALAVLAAGAVPRVMRAQQMRGLPAASTRPDSIARVMSRGIIDGAVTDTNLVPLAGADVTILRTNLRVNTSASGRFRIVDVPAGEYLLIVRRIGYRPTSAVVSVAPPDTLRLAYSLERARPGLDTIKITARRQSVKMQEFEDRRKLGFGEFMSADSIEKRNLPMVMDLLRSFKTVDVSPTNDTAIPSYYALSRREGGGLEGACPMQVLLDGVPLPSPFDLSLLPSPKEISGIEVYAGAATVPPQFLGNDRRCGMILLWTRDG